MNFHPIIKYKYTNRSFNIQRTVNKCVNYIFNKAFVWNLKFSKRIEFLFYLHFT